MKPEMSESIKDLAQALSKAQGEIQNAKKDSENPFFKSRYADLAAAWDACRAALSKHNLSVVQTTDFHPERGLCLLTTLTHSSGEWISGTIPLNPVKNDPQGLGSAISYMRRYALLAIVGIATEDDDGNSASGTSHSNVRPMAAPPAPRPLTHFAHPTEQQLKRLFAIAKNANISTEGLKDILSQEYGRSSTKDLTIDEYNALCEGLEKMALPPAETEFGKSL